MLDCQLFGNSPHGHHAMNVVWHAFNAVLAFLFLWQLTGALWTSAISAALFAWHPLRVESVAWVAERKDVLSTFFGLLALLLYARYAERRKFSSVGPRAGFRLDYGLAFVCFALGLMCKPVLVTLPFVFLLLDGWPLKRYYREQSGKPWIGLIREKIPFLLLSLFSCIVTYAAQNKSGAISESLSFSDRLANALIAVTGYPGKVFWPGNLEIGYPRPLEHSILGVAGAGLLLLGITGFAVWQWRSRPWLIVGWLWFLGMLVPVIGLVPVGQQLMADRYTYLPVLGLQLALLWTLREIVVFQGAGRLAVAGVAVVLALCIARTWNQLAVWQNSSTLYAHVLAVDPDNYLAHTYLGSTLLNENRPAVARDHFQRAVELRPDYRVAQLRLALADERLDQDDAALAVYLNWLKLHPNDGEAQFFCANALARLNRRLEAVPHYYRAIELEPQNADACYNLGAVLQDSGHPDEALCRYRQALALNSKLTDAHYDAGVLLLDRNQPVEALLHFQAVVEMRTNDAAAWLALGLAQEQLDRTQAAIASLEQAQRLNPGAADVSEALSRVRGKLTAANTGRKP
jgi:tetratricopeptide (TPR) repeat protein